MAQPLDFEAADGDYESIRRSRSDVAAIARATGCKERSIRKVKEHLFLHHHMLDRYVAQGFPAVTARFDSDPDVAGAWRRLESGTFEPRDLALLRHETAEAWYMRNIDRSYDAAHIAAQKRFPAPEW